MSVGIECTFFNNILSVGNLYTCEVRSASITKSGTRVRSYKVEHLPGKTNNDVESIYFTQTVVNFFPVGLGKIFLNLKHLEIDNCGLREISRRDLIGLENLTSLRLRGNALQSLPDNLFSRMTNLTIVDFNCNRLEFLSSKLLRPIMNNKLEMVDFASIASFLSSSKAPFRARFKTFGSAEELCDYIDGNYKKPITMQQENVVKDFTDRLYRGFKELWTSRRFSDFVIVCDSKEFKVHKNVLAIQSPVLAAALGSEMEESKTGRMEIKDFSKEAVEDFLKYLYTGETPKETNAMEILALASKYDVNELKASMEEIVVDNVDETNALEVLVLAKQHNCQMLVQEAFKEIQFMFDDYETDLNSIVDLENLKELIETKRRYESALRRCLSVNL